MAELKMGCLVGPATIALFALAQLGCGGDRGSDPFTTADASITAADDGATGGNDGSSTGTEDPSDGGPKLDVQNEDETGTPGDTGMDCAEVTETAMVGLQPADIIVVVDTSGSMDFEAAAVQANINAFSTQIFLANIDYLVVLIAEFPSGGSGICVESPLGSGGCPLDDDNPPSFLHVDSNVGSTNALEKVITHWPDYEDLLRVGASRHVVIVSDDDSDMNAATFDSMFLALDPGNVEYKLHAIAADEDPVIACLLETSCCAISAAKGQEYMDLVMATDGVWGNLCDQDFQPVFDELSASVIAGATLACEYDIPPPPDGETFDPDEVNVEFDDGLGNALEIGRVDSAADCAGVADGWYYDDPAAPTKILVCPQTCDTVQGFATASVSIKFGCATVVAPPVG